MNMAVIIQQRVLLGKSASQARVVDRQPTIASETHALQSVQLKTSPVNLIVRAVIIVIIRTRTTNEGFGCTDCDYIECIAFRNIMHKRRETAATTIDDVVVVWQA